MRHIWEIASIFVHHNEVIIEGSTKKLMLQNLLKKIVTLPFGLISAVLERGDNFIYVTIAETKKVQLCLKPTFKSFGCYVQIYICTIDIYNTDCYAIITPYNAEIINILDECKIENISLWNRI